MNNYLCIVGAANIDITGFSRHKLIPKDSNIGTLKMALGGVGRNIAENAVRLGIPTKLICPVGDDIYGQKIIESCKELGIDMEDSQFLKNTNSSVHLAIMDETHDIALGLAAMDICDKLDAAFIQAKKSQIEKAKLVVLETNMPEKTLNHVVQHVPGQKYMLDTVSGPKSVRAKNILHALFILKMNKLEAEILSGIKISDEKDLQKAAAFFHKKGTKNAFVTLGENGVFYSNGHVSKMLKPLQAKVVNTNGAGDGFVAGVIYGFWRGEDIDYWARSGLACAALTIMHERTVSPEVGEGRMAEMMARV